MRKNRQAGRYFDARFFRPPVAERLARFDRAGQQEDGLRSEAAEMEAYLLAHPRGREAGSLLAEYRRLVAANRLSSSEPTTVRRRELFGADLDADFTNCFDWFAQASMAAVPSRAHAPSGPRPSPEGLRYAGRVRLAVLLSEPPHVEDR